MTVKDVIDAGRRVSKPILADDPVLDREDRSASVFYTPAGQWIERRMEMIIAAGAGLFLAAAWLISLFGGPGSLRNLFILLSFAIAGIPALTEVWDKVRQFRIDIDLLMLLGACLAAYIGSPFEGALLLFLFALAGAMESFSLRRTQAAIVALRELAPTDATVLRDGGQCRMALRQVSIGNVVLVRPGEKVPLDGEVVAGSSSVNESAITGESVPRECVVGDVVFAGTQNVDGRLEVRVTKLAGDTALAKIVELVTEARQHPARAQRLIDRIGPVYSLAVIGGSVAVALLAMTVFGMASHESIRRGIALLIVASPCALIIATPVAYLSGIAAAARRGVLIKGGAHLEVVSRARVVAFDKTGTLTTGRIRLCGITTDEGVDEDRILRAAGALEAASNHPLADAVNAAMKERRVDAPPVSDYTSVPGEGASGTVEEHKIWIGRPERLADHVPAGVANRFAQRAAVIRQEGKTVSAVTVDRHVALLAFQDTLREQSRNSIARLREQGIAHVEMLTGDHEIVARHVAADLGLDGVRAQLAPHDKVTATKELRDRTGTLVLVGDGINDAPALAHADVGVAMGSMGADVALEAADIVLMNDDILNVAWLHRLAKRTAGIVRQNLTIAIGVIAVLSVFAVLGSIPLPLAVIGHEGSTVIVALNALRLLRDPSKEKPGFHKQQ